jgi:hypothetical protein
LAALRLRYSGRGVLAWGLSPAPTRRRCAGAHDRFRRHLVDRADGILRNPPLHQSRRRLPGFRGPC